MTEITDALGIASMILAFWIIVSLATGLLWVAGAYATRRLRERQDSGRR